MFGLPAHFLSVDKKKPSLFVLFGFRELLTQRKELQMLGNLHLPKDKCPTILNQALQTDFGVESVLNK